MSDKTKLTAEELLSLLLTKFFVSTPSGGLEWGYQEGTTIRELFNLDFEKQMSQYLLPDELLAYRRENSNNGCRGHC